MSDATTPSRTDLPPIETTRKSGSERFVDGPSRTLKLSDFWAWSASDVVNNTERGALAEFIVGSAIDADTIRDGVRHGWAAYDLQAGEISVEVKSAAYIQSWRQSGYSAISFGYRKTRKYDTDTNELDEEPSRVATVYVFALLKHQDQATLNPLDMSQWEFYVVPTVVLDARKRSDSSITLKSLQRFCKPVSYRELKPRVQRAHVFLPNPDVLDRLDKTTSDWSDWPQGCEPPQGSW